MDKKWTLEEAREDYKKSQRKKCCYNCKFYEVITGGNRAGGPYCNVKQDYFKSSYETMVDRDKDRYYCKYFTDKIIK